MMTLEEAFTLTGLCGCLALLYALLTLWPAC